MREEPTQKNYLDPVRARDIIDLTKYKDIPSEASAVELVSTIDHLVQKSNIKEPRIVEIGPVPTTHYERTPGILGRDVYDVAAAKEWRRPLHTPPIWYLAERHPEWHLAAVSPHDIPPDEKTYLLPGHEDLFMHELGPQRKHGLLPDDVFDEGYVAGKDILQKHYPALVKKLGGKPNIIFGRHVFDNNAKGYMVGKLTHMAAMTLEPGGFLVSFVYGSGPQRPHIPIISKSYHFPFDAEKNMKHVLTVEFRHHGDKDYVFVFQKVSDAIRPAYQNVQKKKE